MKRSGCRFGDAEMAEKTTREIALDLLLRIERGGAYSDRILAGPQVAGLDPRDRSLIRELVAGVERWKLRLDRTIDLYYTKRANTLSPEIRMALRLGIYQLGFLDSIPPWGRGKRECGPGDTRAGKSGRRAGKRHSEAVYPRGGAGRLAFRSRGTPLTGTFISPVACSTLDGELWPRNRRKYFERQQ